jgi:hypothetical protein
MHRSIIRTCMVMTLAASPAVLASGQPPRAVTNELPSLPTKTPPVPSKSLPDEFEAELGPPARQVSEVTKVPPSPYPELRMTVEK